jgi:hypothetical protein
MQGSKDLLLPGIPAYPRSARKRHDRSVTPEVARSSLVAPVKVLQISMLCCRIRHQIGADYTDFFPRRAKHAKTGRNPPTLSPFQADLCGAQSDDEVGLRLHKWPEVTGARPVAANAGRAVLAQSRRVDGADAAKGFRSARRGLPRACTENGLSKPSVAKQSLCRGLPPVAQEPSCDGGQSISVKRQVLGTRKPTGLDRVTLTGTDIAIKRTLSGRLRLAERTRAALGGRQMPPSTGSTTRSGSTSPSARRPRSTSRTLEHSSAARRASAARRSHSRRSGR